MVVVVPIAVPCSVPVNVRLPMVDAAGRYESKSVTVPVPAPTSVAESVQLWPLESAPRTLELSGQPFELPAVTLKFVVLVTGFDPVIACVPTSLKTPLKTIDSFVPKL
jgi:hypothetical protein